MSDGTIEASTERMLTRLRKGWIRLESMNKGDLRVLGIGLGVATMEQADGFVYRLHGEELCRPGRRMSRQATDRLREAIRQALP